MPRHRLRFLLHEIDLPLGVTTLGRSADCHLTLDDPLVSRRHVRIVVGADRVVVEDLESRNGVLLNGTVLRGVTELRDGDRIRVGTQEFVFSQLGGSAEATAGRATAELRLCASCRLPYPREVVSCPACEATEQIDEDPDTGDVSPGTSSLELLTDALERAAERLNEAGDAADSQPIAWGGER